MKSTHSPDAPPFLLNTVFPIMKALLRLRYFSFEVKGSEWVPKADPVVYVANHAGWFTIDSFFFAMAISQAAGNHRIPRPVVEDTLLKLPGLKGFFSKFWSVPASQLRNLKKLPRQVEILAMYPEGTAGNCKPFWRSYRMGKWRTGFVRLAIDRRAKVVPLAIIGGEESFPSLGSVDFLKPLIGSVLPIPLSGIPLPTSWKVIFHPPVDFSEFSGSQASDRVFCRKMAAQIQATVQATLDRETADRPMAKLANGLEKLAAAHSFLKRWIPVSPPKRKTHRPHWVSEGAASLRLVRGFNK